MRITTITTSRGSLQRLWLSKKDTYQWASRPGSTWPCSHLSGKRLYAEFSDGDLVDFQVNGHYDDCPADEFNAITSDFLRR